MIDKIYNRMRIKRQLKNVTLEELQKISGIEASYLSRIENGKIKNIELKTLTQLSELYNIPLYDIIIGFYPKLEEKMFYNLANQGDEITKRFMEIYYKFSKKKQQYIGQFLIERIFLEYRNLLGEKNVNK